MGLIDDDDLNVNETQSNHKKVKTKKVTHFSISNTFKLNNASLYEEFNHLNLLFMINSILG